jgi:hypothetical protein
MVTLSDLWIPRKIKVVNTMASIGKQSAEPIDAYLARRITPWPGTSARLDLVASIALLKWGHRETIIRTS